MKLLKYLILFITFCVSLSSAAQHVSTASGRYTSRAAAKVMRQYDDSLRMLHGRVDSLYAAAQANRPIDVSQERFSVLFTPLAFYHSPASRLLQMGGKSTAAGSDSLLAASIDRALMDVYLSRPDLVKQRDSQLTVSLQQMEKAKEKKNVDVDIVDVAMPGPADAGIAQGAGMPGTDILIRKPNFWTFSGDFNLQFLQNYVSGNWYNGGESNYSMVSGAILQANYNNKQKITWDNKLELKLGYQNSRADSLHKFKATEDLIRYTGKLGLQAHRNWYYTFQLIAYTQFTRTYHSNDPMVYSDFMSPFTANFSIGMDYKVNVLKKKLTGTVHLAPLALNWRYVDRVGLATRYGLDEGKHNKLDYGSEVNVDLTWKFSDMIKWRSRLYCYTTYKRFEMEWENTVAFQLTRFLSTNIVVYPRFDDAATRDDNLGYWQFKEYASMGFAFSF